MAQLVLDDSRRLTGPNLISDAAGAILDISIDGLPVDVVVNVWRRTAREVLDAVGWERERLFDRPFERGASLVMSAPIDALYAATEVNEWAWEAAVAELEGSAPLDPATTSQRLRLAIEEERNPKLLALRDAASQHDVMFLWDDDEVSLGMGVGSRTWPATDLPGPADVPWSQIHDIPVVLVTGVNGKTTTVRLLATMVTATNRIPGFSCTDGVFVSHALVDGGDYSGPGGARAVLRDGRVEVAILETARGGMLRRGLGVPRAHGAVVINVALDHIGEYGVGDLESVADAKLVIAKAVSNGGTLALNADDEILANRSIPEGAAPVWISQHAESAAILRSTASGGEVVVVEDGWFVRKRGETVTPIVSIDSVPLTLNGAAVYNVENVLAALALSPCLGVPDDAAASALREFRPTPASSPGRTNVFDIGGVTVVVDFAHNPHGMNALVDTVLRMPANRRLLVLGQAGDRDDESIRALVRAACRMEPNRIIIKAMEKYLRGRPPGEVPSIIEDEISRCYGAADVVHMGTETEAARDAMAWARAGDLLVMPVHEDRDGVVELLEGLQQRGWSLGDAV